MDANWKTSYGPIIGKKLQNLVHLKSYNSIYNGLNAWNQLALKQILSKSMLVAWQNMDS